MPLLDKADKQLLEIYNGEFAPTNNWTMVDAQEYRQQLMGRTTGKIARYAPIGSITMGSDIIPDSFPFIKFSAESPDDQELLRRGMLIRNALNKYDPYSSDAWEPIALQNGRGEAVSYDKLKYHENIVADGPVVKDPVVEYLKSLPPSPGPKMRIKSDASSFQSAKYNPDTLFAWTNGEITSPALMLDIHHALKRTAGDYLLTLYKEQQERKIKCMQLIDYEIRQHVKLGTEGKYVNRWSMANALANLNASDKSRLLYDINLDEATYELFNPVIGVDNLGFKKWRKYADYKRKKYNQFMSVLSKEEVATDPSKPDMKAYGVLNADAANRRNAIAAIHRVRVNRAAPAPAPTPAPTPAPFSVAGVMSNKGKADPACRAVKGVAGYLLRMKKLGFPSTDLRDEAKLGALMRQFTEVQLLQLYSGNKGGICPEDQSEILIILGPFDNREVKIYLKSIGGANAANKVKTTLDWANRGDFTVATQRIKDQGEFGAAGCAKIKSGRIGTLSNLDLDDRTVDIALLEMVGAKSETLNVSLNDLTILTVDDCENEKFKNSIALNAEKKRLENEAAEAAADKAAADKAAADKAAEAAADKAAEAAADKAADEAAVEALPKLSVSTGIGGWSPLKNDSGNTLFYAGQPSNHENIIGILSKIPENEHIIQYVEVEPVLQFGRMVFEIDGQKYTISPTAGISKDNNMLITRNAGDALKDENGKINADALEHILNIKEQAVKGLEALHVNGLVHQDIKLDNMAWDGKKLTLIDLGNAKKIEDACEARFNGDLMNILPPPGLGDDKFGDKWALVLALLNLGGNLQAVEEPGDSSITKLLFEATALKKTEGDCFKLKAPKNQSGLMFKSNASNVKYRKNRITEVVGENDARLFHYLWMVWNKKEDILNRETQRGLIPGYADKGAAATSGMSTDATKPKDDHNYMSELVGRMEGNNIDFANAWIDGHLRLEQVEEVIKGKEVSLVTKDKVLVPNTSSKQYDDTKLKDLGELFYGIPTKTVVNIFELIGNKTAAFGVTPTKPRNTFLDYDSFSDAELDDFEASLEPYDENELDKLMEGALTGMAKDAYDSMSDSSGARSYDSSSDTGYSAEAVSYDSSSDGGSGAVYNSESEQSYNTSEHGVSYDSDSDEDR